MSRWILPLLLLASGCGARFPENTIIRDGRVFKFDKASSIDAWRAGGAKVGGQAWFQGKHRRYGFFRILTDDGRRSGDSFDVGGGRWISCLSTTYGGKDWFKCDIPIEIAGLHWIAEAGESDLPVGGPNIAFYDQVKNDASGLIIEAERSGRIFPRKEAEKLEWWKVHGCVFSAFC